MREKKYSLITLAVIPLISTISLVLFTFSRKVFPNYFFLDNNTVRNFMRNLLFSDDKSYGNTANFFSTLGFKYNSSYLHEQLFSWVLFVAIIMVLTVKFQLNFSKITNVILLCFFTLFYAAYFTQMSKELVLVFFITVALLLLTDRLEKFIFILFCVVYAFYFRSYWFLIAFYTVSFTYILRIDQYKISKRVGFFFLVEVFITQIGYFLITNDFITNARYSVNETRIGMSYTNTMINNLFLNTSIITDLVNFIYGFINLIIPIDGLGSANEAVYYLWIWFLLYLMRDKYLKDGYKLNRHFMFILSFIVVQAFFEPDVGSVLRHQIVLIPVIFYMFSERQDENEGNVIDEKSITYQQK